jgi:uncharacterized protein
MGGRDLSSQMKSNHQFTVRRTQAGLGLFTEKPIHRGDFVIEYTGALIPNSATERMKGRYLFQVNSRWTIDGAGRENVSRYINHACKPNCQAFIKRSRILIYAKRNIAAGEELSYDYGKEYFEEFILPEGCRCASCAAR